MNRYLDMTIFQCLNFGKLFSVVFIYVKPTRIYQKTLCCNLFQLGYLYMLVLLYYVILPKNAIVLQQGMNIADH